MIPLDIEAVALIGWAVFPCSRTTRAMAFPGAHRAATCDLDILAKWSVEYTSCNWRVAFGRSNLWGFDLDTPETHKHDGIASMAALVRVHGPLPPRPQARSGGGGLAVFFRHDGERIVGASSVPGPGMDPRRGEQSQTIPPSVHVDTKKTYVWVDPPWVISPPAAPAWLLRLVEPPPERPVGEAPDLKNGDARRNYAIAALHNATRRVAIAHEGGRNDTLNRECWSVAKFLSCGSLTELEVRDCMVAAARAAGVPIREACLTIDSALRAKRR